jgi:hypothetical protein
MSTHLIDGKFYISNVNQSKLRSAIAREYRLLQKTDGTIVLQGAFGWTEGVNGGFDWEDIPTIIKEQE